MTFTATQWNTTQDKEKFVKHFKAFVIGDFSDLMFNKKFYQRMSMMNGHIAHYNQGGFFDEWFSTSSRKADFLSLWTNSRACGDPAYTWCDVEKALSDWLKENPRYEQEARNNYAQIIEHIERTELARLTAKYA